MVKIFILDDHTIFIEGLAAMLERSNPLIYVKGFTEVADLYHELGNTESQDKVVLLLDIHLNRIINGIDVCSEIKQKYPDYLVIALSLHHEQRFVKSMLTAGCDAYVLKTSSFDEIRKAIQNVLLGEQYFSKEIREYISQTREQTELMISLNPREKRVMEGVIQGFTNAEIAKNLNISIKTVEYYRKGIFIKFGVNNAVELAHRMNTNEIIA